jgi:hypothetical protein
MAKELGDWLAWTAHVEYEDFRVVHPKARQHVSAKYA